MNISLRPPDSCPPALDHFIEIYGNKFRRTHFLALRFKRAIITYKSNTLDSVAIEPPHNSIIVVRGKCPPINVLNQSFLLFTDDLQRQGIPVANDSVETLLRALFPADKIYFSFFKSNVLFLVATDNPFSRILHKCRKDQTFKALCNFVDAHVKRKALTLPEVAQLRFFKRFNNELKQFNKWSAFAFALCDDACAQATYSTPSAYLGREVFLVLKRSDQPPGPLPPPDFYQCEILYTDTEPVGVAYCVSNEKNQSLEYVSPMVVSRPREAFRDTSSVICNAWIPLYKNQETWKQYALSQYVYGLHYNRRELRRLLSWLQVQTSEKYKLLLMDLAQVAKIVLGEVP